MVKGGTEIRSYEIMDSYVSNLADDRAREICAQSLTHMDIGQSGHSSGLRRIHTI